MKVLVTGAGGYIGRRVLAKLVEEGHTVFALVRNKERFFHSSSNKSKITVIEGDLERGETLNGIPEDLDAVYFLAHAMTQGVKDFYDIEALIAYNFVEMVKKTKASQIIYLSGITNEPKLSKHLSSRANVEKILISSGINYTILQAGIVIGAASASFEIIRDLVEKLPVMIAPKWVRNRCQPIGIFDVIYYLTSVLGNEKCINKIFEIGGPDILTYKEILLKFAKKRGLKRYIIDVPVLSPRISSFWLYFITSTNFFLARSLVDSMKNEVIRKDFEIDKVFDHRCLPFDEAIDRTFQRIEQNEVVSGWQDSFGSSHLDSDLTHYMEIPKHGCVSIEKHVPFYEPREKIVQRVWTIGGQRGWYYLNWIWQIRGFIDKLCGGVGLRRGRSHAEKLNHGDALDFWRVLIADRDEGRLLLFAEMKVPGEAWLEFRVNEKSLSTHAIFRPKGVLGRLYWWSLYPIHILIFQGMADAIARGKPVD